MKISSYKDFGQAEIRLLFTKTFSDSEGQAEGEVTGGLVFDLMNETKKEDILGFAAAEQGQLVGCVFFTVLAFESQIEAYLLSPVAVSTKHQGKTIGQRLIRFGLEQLKDREVKLVFTYGDPKFYSKVGFEHVSENLVRAPFELSQPEGWLYQSLDGSKVEGLSGSPRCVKALSHSEYW